MEFKIVIIEDEEAIRLGLKDSLEMERYKVFTASDGEAGLEVALRTRPDLIVLDLMLPKLGGYDVCRKIREKGLRAFVLMLTAKKEEMDRIMGFNAGADDYMVKPFSLMELLAKIKAIFRRIGKEQSVVETYRMGRLSMDFKKYEMMIDGKSVECSTKEFEIMKYFVLHPGEAVSREDLLDAVWGYEVYPSTRTVDNFLVRLRQKLEPETDNPTVLKSIRGVGYKFCPENL
ncbi:MAG: hypothetical protein A2293_05680 [Elusimicrobia bacterium RIFOXYB2_FULL_49_7]|nr:MAG: hypothetical protein A2293_05680 [Elusimicrobia bacterium RIFOXYB2_FULL_49_7]